MTNQKTTKNEPTPTTKKSVGATPCEPDITPLSDGQKVNKTTNKIEEIPFETHREHTMEGRSSKYISNPSTSEKNFDKQLLRTINLYARISDLLLPEGEDNELPDDDKKRQLKRAFDALKKLPAGEISRIANTAEKRTEKWPDDIPKVAPELYLDRPAREKLPKFLERVYGNAGYLNGIFTTAHLEIIDPPCAKAVRSWISKHESLPKNILLPNKVNRPKGLKYNRN